MDAAIAPVGGRPAFAVRRPAIDACDKSHAAANAAIWNFLGSMRLIN
jgi:hypothetical protein